MNRYCYCSHVLSGKEEVVRSHWKNKKQTMQADDQEAEIQFWHRLRMGGFESWLQLTDHGHFMVHCLEGESLKWIFEGLREQIANENRVAMRIYNFYKEALGKDYRASDIEPKIEQLMDLTLGERPSQVIKRGYMLPLLPYKEEAHRQFRSESMGVKRTRHEASMRAFGVHRLTVWLQQTSGGKYIVVYSEKREESPEVMAEKSRQAKQSPAWQEISAILMDHTGLSLEAITPEIEWLTKN